jgi:leader peptidase (prepilin peptidase)/N-methyltransferase
MSVGLIAVVAAPFVGSFLTVLAARWPDARAIVMGRSACPACGARLKPLDLVPIFGWLLRRGRCAACGAAISWRYPAAELAALAIALWSALAFDGWLLGASLALGFALLALALIDLEKGLLPDVLTLPLAVGGLGLAAAPAPAGEGPAAAALHAVAALGGYLVFAALAALYRRLRGREGLGLGDAKLLAAGGAWLGPAGLAGIVLVAAAGALLAAAVAARLAGAPLERHARLPFGPFLGLGIWVGWAVGPLVVDLTPLVAVR